MENLQEDVYGIFSRKYNVDVQIWDGTFSSVFLIMYKPEVLKVFKQTRNIEDAVREREVVQALQGHVNIVQYLRSDLETANNSLFYCMIFEYCDLGTVNDYVVHNMNNTRILCTKRILSLIRDVAKGLQHIHARNLIHGNLHPDNLLLQTTGSGHPLCKVSGFRCCHAENDSSYSPERTESCFSAPEPPGDSDNKNSDMFQLGVIICALFNRQVEGNTLVAYFNRNRFADVPEENLTISALQNYTRNNKLPALLVRLLRRNPIERGSASDVLAFLDRSFPGRICVRDTLQRLGSCFRV